MSKVVHLSRSAHERAKLFCLHHGLSMSDWVAGLIERAVNDSSIPLSSPAKPDGCSPGSGASSSPPRERVPMGMRVGEPPGTSAHARDEELELAQMYTAPPFWARERSTSVTASEHA